MKKYLLSLAFVFLFLPIFSSIGFAGKIYSIMLDDTFEAGTIEANSEILQSENFSISTESNKWFVSANIRPKDYHNKRIYILPYKRYIEFDDNKACYEEMSIFVLPLSKLIVVERQIVNHTDQPLSYYSYGGTLITYELR